MESSIVIYGEEVGDYLEYQKRLDGRIEIVDIAVHSGRRKGVGRFLVSELLKNLAPSTVVYAITRTENEIAQQFWEGVGFTTVNPLRRFYGTDKVDALMYVRKAGGPV